MTVTKLATVWCDGIRGFVGGGTDDHAPGCPVWIGNCINTADARAEAEHAGWTYDRGVTRPVDRSRECAAAAAQPEGAGD